MSKLAIDVQEMTKEFDGQAVVKGIGLKVEYGEIFGFLGPNGSGKTTFIRMLCGLLKPDGGQGSVLGYDVITQSREIKRQVGYMTQRFSYYEDLSIEENLEFVARIYGIDRPKEAVVGALQDLGLLERRRQLAGHLSGGWKQRLALAACLIHQPKLLLLDEPTAGVDPKARRDFWDQVHSLAARGLTVLITTHYMDEAERCHRLAYLSKGNILTVGSVAEVIASVPIVTFEVKGRELDLLAEELRKEPGIDSAVAFGSSLHVSGRNEGAIRTALQKQAGSQTWGPIDTSLEDVFIDLMQERSG